MNELCLVVVNLSLCWCLPAPLLGANWILKYQRGCVLLHNPSLSPFTPPTPLSLYVHVQLLQCFPQWKLVCSGETACFPAFHHTQKTHSHLDPQRLVWGQLDTHSLHCWDKVPWGDTDWLKRNSDLHWILSRIYPDLGPSHSICSWSHVEHLYCLYSPLFVA